MNKWQEEIKGSGILPPFPLLSLPSLSKSHLLSPDSCISNQRYSMHHKTLHRIPSFSFLFFFFFVFLLFLGQLLRHMEVPRLGVELELQLPACTTATATLDPSRAHNLHHSSRQRRILNPLGRARIELSSSGFLVGFISAAPQWELWNNFFKKGP